MKTSFLLLLSLFLTSSLDGQADSIKALLATDLPDSTRAKALNDLAFSIHYYDAESCLVAAQEAASLASQLNLQTEETRAYYHQLLAHYVMERFEEGIRAGEMALELATIYRQWRLKFDIHQSLSTLRREIDDIVRSLEDADQMIAIAEELDDEQMLNTAEMNLANLYLVQGNRTLAKSIIENVVDRRIDQKDTIGLAGVYGFLADLEIDINKRAAILNRALNLAESGKSLFDKINLNWIYGNFLRKDKSRLEEAIKHYRKALKMASNIQEPFYSLVSAHSIGSSYAELEQIDSARYYYDLALSIRPTRNTLSYHIQALRDKSKLEYKVGNTDQAYSYQQEAMILSDSLYEQERQRLVTDAQTRYDLSQKEDQILAAQLEAANQQSSKQKLLIAGLLTLFGLVLGFQYYRIIQGKRKQAIEQDLIREQAESDRLRELDEMKTQFFTNVSHELRTPLTLITSPLEESLKELKQITLESNLQTAYRNSQKLLGLTNEILDLAKLEAGQLSLEVDSFFVLPQVERLLAAFSSRADIQKIDLQLQSEIEVSLPILADLKSFETIFNNLMANALKFTPVGGSVIVKLSNAHEKFQLSITDSGSGIHPEDQPHIFDRFYQSRHQPHAEGGTGIGLSLSKRLADLMQGALTVKSEVEKGSQFTLTLPIGDTNQVKSEPTTIETRASLASPDKNRTDLLNPPVANLSSLPRLLIVEDNIDLANYLMNSLSSHFHCTLAG
ncbi:MAG: tetratricopeptide repeat-containing sensor histidine kinase, partial [Bacteroidota bacterium]